MATTVKAIYKGDLHTDATHLQSGTTIIMDAPTDNGGKGESFSPTDLLATALSGCILTIMGKSAQVHGFSIDGTEVDVTKVMGTNPRRVIEVVVELNFPSDYSAKERKFLEAAAAECPVAQSLHPDLKQTLIFNYGK